MESQELSDNKTDQITAEMFPEATVSVIVKYKGKLYTKGAVLSDLKDGSELYRSLARVRLLLHGMQLTIFHNLAGHPQDDSLDEWYKKSRTAHMARDVQRGIDPDA